MKDLLGDQQYDAPWPGTSSNPTTLACPRSSGRLQRMGLVSQAAIFSMHPSVPRHGEACTQSMVRDDACPLAASSRPSTSRQA
ncbi:MAG: hypothetical protein HPY61_00270 [Methanotrichaceae archaeon]|nr:hypothetical protein [Methanotrichaceae archaeon]